jgi:hypothetical protein
MGIRPVLPGDRERRPPRSHGHLIEPGWPPESRPPSRDPATRSGVAKPASRVRGETSCVLSDGCLWQAGTGAAQAAEANHRTWRDQEEPSCATVESPAPQHSASRSPHPRRSRSRICAARTRATPPRPRHLQCRRGDGRQAPAARPPPRMAGRLGRRWHRCRRRAHRDSAGDRGHVRGHAPPTWWRRMLAALADSTRDWRRRAACNDHAITSVATFSAGALMSDSGAVATSAPRRRPGHRRLPLTSGRASPAVPYPDGRDRTCTRSDSSSSLRSAVRRRSSRSPGEPTLSRRDQPSAPGRNAAPKAPPAGAR